MMLGLIGAAAENALGRVLRCGNGQRTRRVDGRLAPDHVDLVFLQQEADAGVELLRHPARALNDGLGVKPDIVGRETIVLGMLKIMVNFCRAQQRLRGNAAPVQTDAAQMRALDDGSLEAELRCANGGDIPAGPRSDDDDIV